jgi:hypothetical protein
MPLRLTLALLLLGVCAQALGQGEAPASNALPAAETPQEGFTEQGAELWRRMKEQAGELWQRSRDASVGAWDSARDSLAPTEPDGFSQVWVNVVPKLEETVALEDAQRDLPDKAWFRRDKRDAQEEINQLLDESVAILSSSPVQLYRERIAALERQVDAARADIDRYRKERVAAPAQSFTAKTVDDYDRMIDEREQDIRRYRAELDRIKREFASDLRALGLELSDEQVQFLLSTVVGDNMVDLGIVFDNVKAITAQLEQLVRDSGEDLKSARRYYGMYVVLLRALNRMHLDVEQAIDQEYIPRINAIAQRARALSQDTRALLGAHPEKAEVLSANLDAQQLTIDAAGIYRDYLQQQAAQVRSARTALEEDIDTAWNTYETVRVSGELVDLVKSSQQVLDGLLNRQVPPLRPFQNLEMQREFAKLTEQLRTARE